MKYNKIKFETISLAVSGNEEAISIILNHYDNYINSLSISKNYNCSDVPTVYLDLNMKADLQIKLITAIFKFKV